MRSLTSSTFKPGIAQRLAGAAGRNKLDAIAGKRARKFDDAGFVGDGNEGARGAAQMLGHVIAAPYPYPLPDHGGQRYS